MSTMQLHSDDFEVCLYDDVKAMLSEARDRVAKDLYIDREPSWNKIVWEHAGDITRKKYLARADRLLTVIKEAL
jgi:hypothetical protein